ncbi:hypothetical protein EOE67_19960 [Rheinheimera riviphila]|uniref:Uncharacterized protein n=1 Tax=Rheinheimera riviphila TaxID=1834037 RepID=A0A437Q9M3_9GAMM|nr:hypothetical protein [Rheinheimera riviphila]RVU31274.1 hypothetical protein EOE67_19960 [Rheinheimera riviphila]
MEFFLVLISLSLLILSYHFHAKLYALAGEPQIYAEVALELHQQAHELLMRKDQIEASQSPEGSDENERWKNDLAQYMEDYEQKGLVRRRVHLGR